MRLIDADWVLAALGVFNDRKHGDAHFFNGIASAEEIVEHAPTIATRDWTPCAEGLPGKETDNVLVCFLDKFGFMEVSIGWYWIPNEKWYTDAKSSPVDVIAWQPLPAAWKEPENV